MNRLTKIKLGWKYRRPLWKYRNLLRHRKEIAAAAGALVVAGFFVKRLSAH
jgi:hypothetical protein